MMIPPFSYNSETKAKTQSLCSSLSKTITDWYPTTSLRPYTLVFPILANRNLVLLGMKKRGFGAGKWNGFGGKVDIGETLQAAAVRELKEESGLDAKVENLKFVGRNWFGFEGKDALMDVHIWIVEDWDGDAFETEEMAPRWFSYTPQLKPTTTQFNSHSNLDENLLDFSLMWEDDKLWFPIMVQSLHDGRLDQFTRQGQELFVGRCDFQSPDKEGQECKVDEGKLIRWEVLERLV